MPHTFLSLDMDLIPQSTKDNVPTFWQGLFSNDNSRMLIDGNNETGELVHTDSSLYAWLQWSDNKEEIVISIISSSIEYTAVEYLLKKNDVNSIWYVEGYN